MNVDCDNLTVQVIAYVGPQPGRLSHGGHALMHLCAGAVMALEQETRDSGAYEEPAEKRRSSDQIRQLLRGLG